MLKYFFTTLCMCLTTVLPAQENDFGRNIRKNVNWGVRAGLDARNSDFHEITHQNGEEVLSLTVTNKVGFQGSVFIRANIDNFFIQADGTFNHMKDHIYFDLPNPPDPANEAASYTPYDFKMRTNSLSGAMLLGYNVVKEETYLFNFFLGPNIRYSYKTEFTIKSADNFEDNNAYFTYNAVVGVSANISYLHFDFRYEFSIPTKSTYHFSDIESAPEELKVISLHRNNNLLSLSIGIMF